MAGCSMSTKSHLRTTYIFQFRVQRGDLYALLYALWIVTKPYGNNQITSHGYRYLARYLVHK